ncbi:MAG: glycoside hydrolase family 44 protein [Polyangiales bacterium]
MLGACSAERAAPTPRPRADGPAEMQLDCSARGQRISELIYGVGAAQDQAVDDDWWSFTSARRWGGNPTSRYNWELGNAWNTGSDWYFENVDYLGEGYSYREFLGRNVLYGIKTALTVPMLGWVAKDTESVGFPRAQQPEQDGFDAERPAAGNGLRRGKPLAAGPPERTSVPAPPEFVQRWVEQIRADDKLRGGRSVDQYILDNEPNLWNTTHRDVRSKPLGYDELLSRTIAYGTAVRRADPDAVIAGPAEWGWANYFFSGKDLTGQAWLPFDRIWHGGVPLIAWYLRKLAEHERRTGRPLLDVLDVHFYPQGEGVYGTATDDDTAARRIRSTRALWDPHYRDESWIAEPVRLLPRMQTWITENYPGRGLSIGEWSFGGEQHMSGALATAEALGRFGQHNVTSAFYWAIPRADSPTAWAFRAYRNFDGEGARFERWSVPASAPEGTSLFASRDDTGQRWVLVALNFEPHEPAPLQIALGACVPPGTARAFVYTGRSEGLVPVPVTREGQQLSLQLPPYALAVIELHP